jgi:hypothetical protein
MNGHLMLQEFHGLTSTLISIVSDNLEQMVVTKLLLGGILGLVESIGIDKEGLTLDIVDVLTDIFEFGP